MKLVATMTLLLVVAAVAAAAAAVRAATAGGGGGFGGLPLNCAGKGNTCLDCVGAGNTDKPWTGCRFVVSNSGATKHCVGPFAPGILGAYADKNNPCPSTGDPMAAAIPTGAVAGGGTRAEFGLDAAHAFPLAQLLTNLANLGTSASAATEVEFKGAGIAQATAAASFSLRAKIAETAALLIASTGDVTFASGLDIGATARAGVSVNGKAKLAAAKTALVKGRLQIEAAANGATNGWAQFTGDAGSKLEIEAGAFLEASGELDGLARVGADASGAASALAIELQTGATVDVAADAGVQARGVALYGSGIVLKAGADAAAAVKLLAPVVEAHAALAVNVAKVELGGALSIFAAASVGDDKMGVVDPVVFGKAASASASAKAKVVVNGTAAANAGAKLSIGAARQAKIAADTALTITGEAQVELKAGAKLWVGGALECAKAATASTKAAFALAADAELTLGATDASVGASGSANANATGAATIDFDACPVAGGIVKVAPAASASAFADVRGKLAAAKLALEANAKARVKGAVEITGALEVNANAELRWEAKASAADNKGVGSLKVAASGKLTVDAAAAARLTASGDVDIKGALKVVVPASAAKGTKIVIVKASGTLTSAPASTAIVVEASAGASAGGGRKRAETDASNDWEMQNENNEMAVVRKTDGTDTTGTPSGAATPGDGTTTSGAAANSAALALVALLAAAVALLA